MRVDGLLTLLALACSLGLGCSDPADPVRSRVGAVVESTSIVEVGHTEARVSARIDPSPSGSRFWCWYGLGRAPDSLAAEGSLDASSLPVDVPVHIEHLQPDTRYYVQWRVAGERGEPSGSLDSLRTLPRNQRPETLLSVALVDSTDGIYRFHVVWRGQDSDGSVVAFDLAKPEEGGETSWTRTARTDSLVSLSVETAYRFMVRAIDDDGAVDPTPAFAWLQARDNVR